MNVLHVITSMGLNWGGPVLTTLLTAEGLRDINVDATIVTYDVAAPDKPISEASFIIPLARLSSLRKPFGWSLDMKRHVRNSYADLFHIHGLWQYPTYITARLALKRKKPYLITLHGQLYPQALALSSLKKKIALRLFQRELLQKAVCIHATCEEEYRHYRNLGYTNPVAVIPNPMDCNQHPLYQRTDRVKRIGYLGRIHPRKNIDRLIDVWAQLDKTDGELLIMGDGDNAYLKQLKEKVKEMGLEHVVFTGFVSGNEKQELLASLSCLVVPSDFENFGMIVPEALLQQVPVIASTGAPWEELNTHGCGWWVENDVDTLIETVRKALSLDETTRLEMGKRGRELVFQKYSKERVSAQMKQLYTWVQGNTPKPDFLFLD